MAARSATTPIKVMWLNPVPTPDADQATADRIAAIKLPSAEVHVVSLRLDPAIKLTWLEFEADESAIWYPSTAVAHYAAAHGFDGFVIASYTEPAFDDAREASYDMVVTGSCEAGLKTVASLCNRFSVVTGLDKWTLPTERRIRRHGYQDKLASIRTIGMGIADFQRDPTATADAIRRAVRDAIEIDKAEAILLGCTIMYDFHFQLQAELDVPVIDTLYACYKEAELAAMNRVQFGWKPSRIHSMAARTDKELDGLFAGEPPIGNRIVVPRT